MRACDYNAYKIKYQSTQAERVDTCGGMDSELTGRQITQEYAYIVVAPTAELARADFNRYHSKDTVHTIELVGTLSGLVLCH